MSRAPRPVALRVTLSRYSSETSSGIEKMHGSSKTGSKADKYLYFRGRPYKAMVDLLRWLEGADTGDRDVEAVLRKAELRFLTRRDVEEIRESESEVLRWRN